MINLVAVSHTVLRGEHLAVESVRNTIASGIKVQQCSSMKGAASLYLLIQHYDLAFLSRLIICSEFETKKG